MSYSLLPGGTATNLSKNVATPVIVAVLLLAGCLVLLVSDGREPAQVSAAPQPTSTPATSHTEHSVTTSNRDLSFHLKSLGGHLSTAAEEVGRAQTLMGVVAPELGRLGLTGQRRRAEAAIAACETAKQALERALVELQVAVPHQE
jgi:hypothetical protein